MPSPIELSGLFIYPIKSLRGVALTEIALVDGALQGDRLWLLIDAEGRFLHQRDFPQMARIDALPRPGGVSVRREGLPDLEVEAPAGSGPGVPELRHVPLWRRHAPVVPVSEEADRWFTRALGLPCRLMAFVPKAAALHVPDYEVRSTLQDATPFHITHEASLTDLNGRMAAPLPMDRFRPNLVVSGGEAYAEDRWRRIAIGENVFRWIKPCARCAMTRTDQTTGQRSSTEPLATLAGYRRRGHEVVFGDYWVAERWGGTLRVGDPVSILETAPAD